MQLWGRNNGSQKMMEIRQGSPQEHELPNAHINTINSFVMEFVGMEFDEMAYLLQVSIIFGESKLVWSTTPYYILASR